MMVESPSAFQKTLLPPLPVAAQEFDSPSSSPVASPEQNSRDSKSKPSSKKRRKGQACPESVQFFTNGKFVELDEEGLLKLDSQQIEIYLKTIQSVKMLTSSEEKELKRIRRLIKNREYAQSSRDKRKQFTEEMQSKIAIVNDENMLLQTRIQNLELENKNLKLQLAKISLAITKDPEIMQRIKHATSESLVSVSNNNMQNTYLANNPLNSTTFMYNHNTSVNMIPTPTPLASFNDVNASSSVRSNKSGNNNNSNKRKKAAVSFFVVLFSFGLLFSPLGSSFLPSSTSSSSSSFAPGVDWLPRRILADSIELEQPSLLMKFATYLPPSVQNLLYDYYVDDYSSDHDGLASCPVDDNEEQFSPYDYDRHNHYEKQEEHGLTGIVEEENVNELTNLVILANSTEVVVDTASATTQQL